MQDQVKGLSDTIATEHTLSEQITDLREMKAIVSGQLHALELALRDARLDNQRLLARKCEHERRVAMLESLPIRQPVTDLHTLFRLERMEEANKTLQQDLVAKTAEATSLSGNVEQKDGELRRLRKEMLDT